MSGGQMFSYIGAPYLIGVVITVLVGVLMAHPDSADRDRRAGARLLLLSPVWPLPAAVALVRGLVQLWQLAEWKRP